MPSLKLGLTTNPQTPINSLASSFHPAPLCAGPYQSVNQMRIVADGYIQSLQEANQSLGQCVDGLIDEVDRIQAVNEEILRTAEAMAKIGKDLG